MLLGFTVTRINTGRRVVSPLSGVPIGTIALNKVQISGDNCSCFKQIFLRSACKILIWIIPLRHGAAPIQ